MVKLCGPFPVELFLGWDLFRVFFVMVFMWCFSWFCFINILIANLYNKESKLYEINNSNSLNDEILTTILSVIIEDTNLSISLKENKQLLDKRIMPSRFIIEKMISNYYYLKQFPAKGYYHSDYRSDYS